MDSTNRRHRRWWLVATVAALGLIGGPARAQNTKVLRSDTLGALGVGARSIGMGGAFVSVADDVTAIFWNPAGLTQVGRQFAFDVRTLPKSFLDIDNFTRNVSSTSAQFSFVGISLAGENGGFGFSRTLAGFEDTDFVSTLAGQRLRGREIARYWFNTLAYGQRLKDFSKGNLRYGIGATWVQLDALATGAAVGLGGPAEDQGTGDGFTFTLGLLYDPAPESRWTFGLSYLNPTSIGDIGLQAPVFGDRVGGRVSAGASYRIRENRDSDGKLTGRLLGSVEGRHYFAGDDSAVVESREPTTDVHVGFEYMVQPGAKPWRYALRAGFYTRNSPNDTIFYDDRVVTFGVGVERKDRYSADLGIEFSTVTGDPLLTTSVRYTLGGKPGAGSKKPAAKPPVAKPAEKAK